MNNKPTTVSVPLATQNIIEVLEMSRRLQILAERGEQHCSGSTCALLYATVRDSAFRIRQLAERARDKHIAFGTWKPENAPGKKTPGGCL